LGFGENAKEISLLKFFLKYCQFWDTFDIIQTHIGINVVHGDRIHNTSVFQEPFQTSLTNNCPEMYDEYIKNVKRKKAHIQEWSGKNEKYTKFVIN